MSENKLCDRITFNNMRINSIAYESGVFSGYNKQYNSDSTRDIQFGFGSVKGEDNVLENSCNVVTDPGSSSELLEYFKQLVEKKLRG